MVPAVRIHDANTAPERADGAFVLYWMIAHRRPFWNHALEHAVAQAQRLRKPLLIFEPLRLGYEWASDRLHQFVIEGMRDNAEAFARTTATYVPWVELTADAGKGLLARLAARACLVVTDEFPCFFLPRMVAAAAAGLPVRMQTVDANGLFPLRASDRARDRAVDFRRLLQKELRPHLAQFPLEDPLKGVRLHRLTALPPELVPELVPADLSALLSGGIAALPIDHGVGPGIMRGGWKAAQAAQDEFFGHHLADFAAQRSDVEVSAASGFSPYLHFGHLSAHQVVAALWAQEEWSPERLAPTATASKEGWWGMSANAEAFIDQLLTWRELGYHFCFHRPDYASYESLPAWARASLDAHSLDPRTHRYTRAEFAASQTHDPLWNAAQRQLVSEGRMHNYLRMLWAKKILEWSASSRQALATMIELNNRYALDGRNPNSYSGIMWCLGRFDRPWAPQRPIFGCIRYMSSDNTARKMRVKGYLARYAGNSAQTRLF